MTLFAAAAAAAAVSLALLSAPSAALVLDGHVHISNLSLTYPWSAPCPDTPCPAAPPCLCEWTPAAYTAATTRLPADRFVFVEVAVAAAQWLAEARWVQSLADGGEQRIGAIISQPPPGFGVPGADPAALGAALDELAALPLARGVRLSAIDFTNASLLPTAVAHVALLAARGLRSVDVIVGVGELALAAGNLAALAAVRKRLHPARLGQPLRLRHGHLDEDEAVGRQPRRGRRVVRGRPLAEAGRRGGARRVGAGRAPRVDEAQVREVHVAVEHERRAGGEWQEEQRAKTQRHCARRRVWEMISTPSETPSDVQRIG